MRVFYGQDALVSRWVARQIPHMQDGFGPCVAAGVADEDGNIIGGVVWHDYRPRYGTIEMSGAAKTPHWLTAGIITEIMRYPFVQLRCRKVRTITPRKNIRARQFNIRLGFKQEGKLRREFGGDDAIVFGMLTSDWRRSPFNLDAAAPVAQNEEEEPIHA